MSKTSFILYSEYRDHINLLSQSQKGDLLDALFCHANDEECELEGLTSMAFSFIAAQVNRDYIKYQQVKERRVEAGRKGGLAKASNAKQSKAKPSKKKQPVTNLAVYDNENVNVNGNVDVNDIKIDTKVSSPSSKEKDEAFDLFYSHYPRKTGKKAAERKWKTLNPDEMQLAIDVVQTSLFQDYMKAQVRGGEDFRKHPATWLTGGCWSDDMTITKKQTAHEKRVADFQKLRENG